MIKGAVFSSCLFFFLKLSVCASPFDFVDPLIGAEGAGSEYGGTMPMTSVLPKSHQSVATKLTKNCCAHCTKSVKVIFDTDMITDFDDVGALACLHAMADAGPQWGLTPWTENVDK